MRRSLVLLATAVAAVVAADLTHKAVAVAARGDELFLHERSADYAVGVILAAGAWCGALLATRSAGLALVGGLVLGGAVANVASLALWPAHEGIPNPLLLGTTASGVAFNVADAAVFVSVFVLLPPALVVFARRNRHRLREPVRLSPYPRSAR